jgi:penicillin-binding protein 2
VLNMSLTDLQNKVRLCTATVSQPCWNGSPYQPIPVAQDVSTQVALTIVQQQENFPGVTVTTEPIIQYPAPYGVNAAQELGYVTPVTQQDLDDQPKGSPPLLAGTDQIGSTGLEQSFDSYLRGTDGTTTLAVDNLGRVVGTVSQTAEVPGDDVVSTLDARVQAAAEQQLWAGIQRARATPVFIGGQTLSQHYIADSGSIVVMDVHTGRIVAMATYPTYNPDEFVGGISAANYAALTAPSANDPLISRAFQGEYAPGSTFKVVSSSAAIQDGFDPNSLYDCSSNFSAGGHTFDNDESESAGEIDLAQAIAISCDTVFYRIGYQMYLNDGGANPVAHPKDPIQNMALDFGLGKTTGLDIPGEASGQILTRQLKQQIWDQNHQYWCFEAQNDTSLSAYDRALDADNCKDYYVWFPGDAINESIGQGGVLVTPLQLARMYSAVANGGTLYEPQLARAIVTPSGKLVKNLPPVVEGHVPLQPSTQQFLVHALEGVTTGGTAAPAFEGWPQSQIPIATKTGTAEVNGKQTTSVFASFAPANNPQYAIVMIVSQGGWGYTTSGVSVRNVYGDLFGVNGSTIDPSKAIFPSGAPPSGLPTINADGTIDAAPSSFMGPATPGHDGAPWVGDLPYVEPPDKYHLRT